ncbi:hypothetical protein GUJ93_ZPchr0010g7596 [Zizania palustris]|uniref:Uncharacterized protein n=1 Tax=Zizania palustris TaxID=103762 RepID=A0A8J5WBC2_ZIZPA|nr:hypothetical protein GUJ93_ZPchr0010g7596 [Zizania palustris]
MDGRKKSPAATAAGAPAPASASAAAPNGYFSSVFSASPAANAKDAKQPDLYAMLNKQNFKGQNGGAIADGKSNGSPTKGRTANKDGKQFYPNESSESPYFGSSVHYGAREFYGSTPQKQGDESAKKYNEENPDGSLATRGDWWQVGHSFCVQEIKGVLGAGLQ